MTKLLEFPLPFLLDLLVIVFPEIDNLFKILGKKRFQGIEERIPEDQRREFCGVASLHYRVGFRVCCIHIAQFVVIVLRIGATGRTADSPVVLCKAVKIEQHGCQITTAVFLFVASPGQGV